MADGILTGDDIRLWQREGGVVIDPFVDGQVNPASYDLTLGDEVCVYERWVRCEPGALMRPKHLVLDVREEPEVTRMTIGPEGLVLEPSIGYLMHTVERVHTKRFVPVLDGKSSLGRLFMQVHATAGYGDPGFDGQYTLEVTVQHPLRVYAGMRVAQIRFHTTLGIPRQLYDGKYKGEASRGAVPSRAWKQFK